ncbi:hypothetical protein WJ50_09950 [Burkholderia ubonensis]|nr:hypothetical protein WJ50_09950 [Burkholderia ubonensis]KVN63651.1 hypothetical protein WJ65_18070 [Burkholderia ubonensis]
MVIDTRPVRMSSRAMEIHGPPRLGLKSHPFDFLVTGLRISETNRRYEILIIEIFPDEVFFQCKDRVALDSFGIGCHLP